MTPPSSRLAGKRPSKTSIGSYDYWVKRAKKAEALARGFEADAKAANEATETIRAAYNGQRERAERAEADLKAVREAEARQELRVIDLQEKLQATDENFGRAIKERDAARAENARLLQAVEHYGITEWNAHEEALDKARAEADALRDGLEQTMAWVRAGDRVEALKKGRAALSSATAKPGGACPYGGDHDWQTSVKQNEWFCSRCKERRAAKEGCHCGHGYSGDPGHIEPAPAPPKACRVCEWVADTTADGIPRFVEIAEIIALVHGPACPTRKGV